MVLPSPTKRQGTNGSGQIGCTLRVSRRKHTLSDMWFTSFTSVIISVLVIAAVPEPELNLFTQHILGVQLWAMLSHWLRAGPLGFSQSSPQQVAFRCSLSDCCMKQQLHLLPAFVLLLFILTLLLSFLSMLMDPFSCGSKVLSQCVSFVNPLGGNYLNPSRTVLVLTF